MPRSPQPLDLDAAILALKEQGADPRLGMPELVPVTKVVGWGSVHLAAAFGLGVIAAMGLLGAAISVQHLSFATSEDRKVLDAVGLAGVEVTKLGTEDLRARLLLDQAQASSISSLGAMLPVEILREAGMRTSRIAAADRKEYMSVIFEVEAAIHRNSAKLIIFRDLAKLTDADALSLADGGGITSILALLAKLSKADRDLVTAGRIPVIPINQERAELFAGINDPAFPASLLVAAFRQHPEHVREAIAYLNGNSKLPVCKPIACIPVYCSLAGYECKAGYYPTMGTPVCIAVPKTKSR